MVNQQANSVADRARSDLAQLWQAAVEEYKNATGKRLRLRRFKSMDDVMNSTKCMSMKFEGFHNNKSKVSKVRTALKNNMWLIENIVHTVQNVGNAASAFPPAMPASLIFTAFGQIMQSFADVSADYDKIMGFFDFTYRFFDRLSMIGQKMPNIPSFQRCVTRVFSNILKICSVAERYAAKKRLRKWFENLMKGSDEELDAASTQMEEAVNELGQAVGLTTLRTVDAMSEVLLSMTGNAEFLVSNATLIDERTAAIQSNTTTVIKQNQDLASNQKTMTGLQQETLERMGEYFGQFQITPKQQEAPPEPVSTVPFNRDPEFIDRGTLLDEINERLPKLSSDGNYSNSRSRIALVGLGGVGKSQLAIEYSYRIRTQSAKTWVFWIHASNAARFEQSYREIADRAKITGRHDPKANIFKLVCDWLQDAKHEHWVLILDNVDDYGFLHAPIPVKPEGQADNRDGFKQPLSTFIPQCQHGLLVMTTRSRSVASRFVDDSDIITVNPMDNSQASALMEKKLGMPANKEDILKLTEALEFMPLAIVQAAAYIKQRTPRASVPQYLEELQKSDRKRARLLDHEAGHRQRDWEAKNSILATWQISFDHIQETRPSAADLLSLMSFFDRQGISEELLLDVKTQKDGSNSDDDSITDSDFDDGFEDDIMTLRDYSFISISQDAKVFEMHRLVQLSTRTWFETCGQIEHWKEQFISKLYREFPSGEYENWGKCQLLFPHVKSAMSQRPSSQESLQEWARLLDSGVIYALGKGNVIGIEPMAVKAMKAYKKIFGAEHPDTLMSMKNLASTFQKLGRLHEAETLEVQVLQTRKRVLDAEHPETLISMASLALTFYELGRVQEAEALVVQVLEAHKRVFGVEHPHTLMSMNNLASIFGNLGRFQEAEALEVQVLETQKRLLGAEHPHTLMSMKNLASMFWNLGRFQEAEALEVQALDACKRVLGAEHPDTLASMNNLASMFYNLGRLQEAETLEVQALDIRKRVLGAEHPDTLMSMNNLALKSHNLGRLQEAEPLEIQMLATCKRVLSAKHSYTLKSMANLAVTWKALGQDTNALDLMRDCLAKTKQALGIYHPDALSSSKTILE